MTVCGHNSYPFGDPLNRKLVATVLTTVAAAVASPLVAQPALADTRSASCTIQYSTNTFRGAVSVDVYQNDSTHWYNTSPRYRLDTPVGTDNPRTTSNNSISMFVHDYRNGNNGLSRYLGNRTNDGVLRSFTNGSFVSNKG